MAQGRRTGLIVFVTILSVVAGIAIGAGGLYLIGPKPHKNLEEELWAKTAELEAMQHRMDSLNSQLQETKTLPQRHEKIIKTLMHPDSLNKVVTLGAAVGGRWHLQAVEDVTFLADDLVFARIADGHVVAYVLLRVHDPADTKTWRMLWGDYNP